MTHRALSLLSLTSASLILDIGCGSGLSGAILSHPSPPSNAHAHTWVGLDISPSMLDIARQRPEVTGDLLLADAGQGVPFRPGSFDAAISISAVQWLCSAESSDASAPQRLARFFGGLYAALRRGARAVCQFYPRDAAQRAMVSGAAIRAGFGAGILEDDPGTKNAKLYLVLTVGGGAVPAGAGIAGVVRGLEGVAVVDERRGGSGRAKDGKRGSGKRKGGKQWILRKKEQMERKGKVVKPSSKYTGRKRGPVF